jgi:hypothetical protein
MKFRKYSIRVPHSAIPTWHDDAAWHPLPNKEGRPPIFPTAERLRRQLRRAASKLGEDPELIEFSHYTRLRALQGHYGYLSELLAKNDLAKEKLDLAIILAFQLGQAYPPEESIAAARKARAAKWHKDALVHAAEILNKHPSYKLPRLANLVFAKLQKKPNGPKSAAAVLKCLQRKLDNWTDVQQKLDD